MTGLAQLRNEFRSGSTAGRAKCMAMVHEDRPYHTGRPDFTHGQSSGRLAMGGYPAKARPSGACRLELRWPALRSDGCHPCLAERRSHRALQGAISSPSCRASAQWHGHLRILEIRPRPHSAIDGVGRPVGRPERPCREGHSEAAEEAIAHRFPVGLPAIKNQTPRHTGHDRLGDRSSAGRQGSSTGGRSGALAAGRQSCLHRTRWPSLHITMGGAGARRNEDQQAVPVARRCTGSVRSQVAGA